jgi:hypothetical protein
MGAWLHHDAGMRTTLVLDDEVFDAAMHIARTSGQRIGQVVSDLARRGLNPGAEVQIVQSGRFPSFAVPEGTPGMDSETVQRVLDEEGF